MAKLLTPELEAKILAALEKTASLVDEDGLDPSTALAKAAVAQGLGPGHINPMVAAFNQSRTRARQRDGDTLLEKTATFELADSAKVLDQLYPDTPKTAAQRQHDTAVSLEYSYPPTGLVRRKAAQAAFPAGPLPPLTNKTLPPVPALRDTPEEQAKRAWEHARRLEREAAELRREATIAQRDMATAFCKLADYFDHVGSLPIAVVRENVLITRGDSVATVFDELVRLNPSLRKTASHALVDLAKGEVETSPCDWAVGEKHAHLQHLSATGEPYNLVDDVIAAANRWLACKGPAAEKQAAAAAATHALTAVPSPTIDPLEAFLKEADGFGMVGNIGNYLQSAFKNTATALHGDPDKNVQKSYEAITDPEHLANLRAINTRANLQDLMTTDPVIRSYPAPDVLDAFNDLAETSPSAADRQMIMRAALRRQLQQGQTDLFEADQLLGMENKLRQGARLGEGGSPLVLNQ